MRRITVALLLAGTLLTACETGGSPESPGGPAGGFTVAHVNVDGRLVTCVTWSNGYQGGLSCDW